MALSIVGGEGKSLHPRCPAQLLIERGDNQSRPFHSERRGEVHGVVRAKGVPLRKFPCRTCDLLSEFNQFDLA